MWWCFGIWSVFGSTFFIRLVATPLQLFFNFCAPQKKKQTRVRILQIISSHSSRYSCLTFNDAGLLEHIFKRVVNFLESWPFIWRPLPTLSHQFINFRRTTRRTFHSEIKGNVEQHKEKSIILIIIIIFKTVRCIEKKLEVQKERISIEIFHYWELKSKKTQDIVNALRGKCINIVECFGFLNKVRNHIFSILRTEKTLEYIVGREMEKIQRTTCFSRS